MLREGLEPIEISTRIRTVLARNGPERCSKRILDGAGAFSARVLCLGKAAPALAKAAEKAFPGVGGLVYGTTKAPVPRSFRALWGDHPLPTSRNLENTGMVRKWLRESRGRLLVCLSGGTSALIVEPAGDWPLEAKRELTITLFKSGASIREVNTVRSRLSLVKAGGLLADVGESEVVTAIWSDVGPRDAMLTGSGPTIPWSGGESAEEILSRYHIEAPLPLPPRRPRIPAPNARWFLLSDAIRFRRLVADEFRILGPKVVETAVPEGIGARELAARIVEKVSRTRGSCFLVGVGEATVPGGDFSGCGGRCSHLVAETALAVLNSDFGFKWAFAAVATDGVDGSAGGGAFTGSNCVPEKERLIQAVESFETAGLWRDAGTLLPRRPTGNNLRDAWVFFRGAARP